MYLAESLSITLRSSSYMYKEVLYSLAGIDETKTVIVEEL